MNELVRELKIVARLLDAHSPADAKIVRKAIAALTREGKVCISRECADYMAESFRHRIACSEAHKKGYPNSKSNNRHLALEKNYLAELRAALGAPR